VSGRLVPGPADAAPAHPAYGLLRTVTQAAAVVLAENPSPMTLDGTNTWILRAPGQAGCVVVDPGPEDPAHLDRLEACGPVELVVLTHRHLDHTEAARTFAAVSSRIRASHGRPITVTVERSGRRVTLGPRATILSHGRYIWGFSPEFRSAIRCGKAHGFASHRATVPRSFRESPANNGTPSSCFASASALIADFDPSGSAPP